MQVTQRGLNGGLGFVRSAIAGLHGGIVRPHFRALAAMTIVGTRRAFGGSDKDAATVLCNAGQSSISNVLCSPLSLSNASISTERPDTPFQALAAT